MKIITTAFNGYGKYIPSFLECVEKQMVKPEEVIIVLGKNHGAGEIKGATVVKTELECLGSLINEGMKQVNKNDMVLCFNVDDILLPNAIDEIEKVEADIVTLKYRAGKGIYGTPEITMAKVKNWQKYYLGPSGYLAFRKQQVLDTDFWQWPVLWGARSAGKTIKETDNVCAEWILRPDSHGSGKNVQRAIEFLDKWAEKYTSKPTFSIFSIVKDEESMCKEAWQSAKGADELVICIDDRTTDKTPEIAKKYTDKIHYFKWEDDFSKAKNFAMSKCSSDWVMNLDADCMLEKGGMKKIRHAIKETEFDMIDTTLYPRGRPWENHQLPKIFRRGKIKYEGMAHEHPMGGKRDFKDYGIKIEYDYSPNHAKDKERYIRILTKQVKKDPDNSRWKFYLAREYYYHKDFKEAIPKLEEYLKVTNFLAEKADAYIMLAKCYWQTQQGEKARECCLHAIRINPNFKEAFRTMAGMVWPRHQQRWIDFSKLADNSEELFIRGPES